MKICFYFSLQTTIIDAKNIQLILFFHHNFYTNSDFNNKKVILIQSSIGRCWKRKKKKKQNHIVVFVNQQRLSTPVPSNDFYFLFGMGACVCVREPLMRWKIVSLFLLVSIKRQWVWHCSKWTWNKYSATQWTDATAIDSQIWLYPIRCQHFQMSMKTISRSYDFQFFLFVSMCQINLWLSIQIHIMQTFEMHENNNWQSNFTSFMLLFGFVCVPLFTHWI